MKQDGAWGVTQYIDGMILKIRHKGLRALYKNGQTSGLHAPWVPRLERILSALDIASEPGDLNMNTYHLHPLKGNYKGYWSVRVSGNWRVIFRFENETVTDVDLISYH